MKLSKFEITNLPHSLGLDEYYFLGLVGLRLPNAMVFGCGYNEEGCSQFISNTPEFRSKIRPLVPDNLVIMASVPREISLHKSVNSLRGYSPFNGLFAVYIYNTYTDSVSLFRIFNSLNDYDEWVEANSTF